MDHVTSAILEPPRAAEKPQAYSVPFGVNEIRLSARQWLAALLIVTLVLVATPRLWRKVERFDPAADYRIPYALSKDYWLCQRRLEQLKEPSTVAVLGDSVVWGEYVRPEGTLSHFLNRQADSPNRFANCGVNGLFPLAMEGLVDHYAAALRGRKVLLHCNLLWMSSPKADLHTRKEQTFNHYRLVPQFIPWIPCYRADANERLGVVIEQHVPFSSWVGHLQNAYYDQRSIPAWTLVDDEGTPPHYPNAWANPLAPIGRGIPTDPPNDPQRGPSSSRHKPWDAAGAETISFEWVELDTSFQWQAFQRTVHLLQSRQNDLLVVVGPFNEHLIDPEQRGTHSAMRDRVAAWLVAQKIPHVIPETLPSRLYADASHPLTEGYDLLAQRFWADSTFRAWLARGD